MAMRILVNTAVVTRTGHLGSPPAAAAGSPTVAGPATTAPIAATIIIDATGNVTPEGRHRRRRLARDVHEQSHAGHEMTSDPHPEHTLCPSLNTVGLISPGQSRTSSNLNTATVCTYHDHINDTNAKLKGTIRVQ